MSLATGQMNQTATGDLRIDKKEQAKSLKTIQDYTDVGEYSKAIKYINLRKKSWMLIYTLGLTKNIN